MAWLDVKNSFASIEREIQVQVARIERGMH